MFTEVFHFIFYWFTKWYVWITRLFNWIIDKAKRKITKILQKAEESKIKKIHLGFDIGKQNVFIALISITDDFIIFILYNYYFSYICLRFITYIHKSSTHQKGAIEAQLSNIAITSINSIATNGKDIKLLRHCKNNKRTIGRTYPFLYYVINQYRTRQSAKTWSHLTFSAMRVIKAFQTK